MTDPDFERAFAALRPRLERLARALVGPDNGPDAVQDVAVALWQRRGAIRALTLRGYAERAVRNWAADAWRKAANRPPVFSLDAIVPTTEGPVSYGSTLVDPLPGPEAQALRNGFGRFSEPIERLPACNRDALMLVTVGGLSYVDAAARLECAIGTIKSRMCRARIRLREIMR